MSPGPSVTDTVMGSGGIQLRSLRWEAREPRARVLIVHGLGEHAGRYAHVGRALAERGLSVLAYDQRGHGESGGRRGHLSSFEVLVEDLHQVRSAAERGGSPEEPLFLYGHSMGGLVLIRYLQSYRPGTPGVVLSAPWLETAVEIPWWKRAAVDLLRRLAPDLALKTEVEPELLTRDPAMQRAYEEDPLVHHRISTALFDHVREAQGRALAEGLPASTATLVLAPGADEVTDVKVTEEWAEALGGDDVEIWRLEEARHEPHNEPDRAALLQRIADWMDARVPGAGSPPAEG